MTEHNKQNCSLGFFVFTSACISFMWWRLLETLFTIPCSISIPK